MFVCLSVYLFCEHGDLSLKQCLVGNIQRKLQKKINRQLKFLRNHLKDGKD